MPRSRCRLALAASVVVGLFSLPAAAQGVYTTLDYGNDATFLTGIWSAPLRVDR